ncbi:MAG TPA: histidine phosphatase family protein [Bryobacteraceae bacterium]|nr:histidine phosphatase family protein [Bryobacteraceae bacterium]
MSTLTLVRHGQASYMSEEYDKLSRLGEEQSRRLGQFWARHQITFDRVFCGPAQRHIRTMEIAADQVRKAGLPWPEPEALGELDEFDAYQVMKRFVPVLIERDPSVRELWAEFTAGQQSPEAGRLLQKTFEEVARHWSYGEINVPEVETWQQFRERIGRALDRIRERTGKGAWSVAFTSGGPIAATVSHVLELAPKKAIELLWLSRNCSWSEFYFSGDRFSMGAFNAFPHLDQRELLTYR